MTSEEYAREFGNLLLAGARFTDADTNSEAYRRTFILGVQRIMFNGAAEYEVEPDVQGVEVKPLGDLVTDIEEEIVDLIAYAAALKMRDGATGEAMDNLAGLAISMMEIISEVKGA